MMNITKILGSWTLGSLPFRQSNFSCKEDLSDEVVLLAWVGWCRYYRLAPSIEEDFADLEEILQVCDNIGGGVAGVLEPSQAWKDRRPFGGGLKNPAFDALRIAILDAGGSDLKETVSRWEYGKAVDAVKAFVQGGGKVAHPQEEE